MRSFISIRHVNFYPRPPRGGRRVPSSAYTVVVSDFYPRPPRGGRHEVERRVSQRLEISIHALREEGDRRRSGLGHS